MENIRLNQIEKKLRKVQGKNDWYSVLCDCFEIWAISLSNQFDFRKQDLRENRFKQLISKYNEKESKLIAEILYDLISLYQDVVDKKAPFNDYLGKIFMSSNTSNAEAGQIFTPFCLSKITAELSTGKEKIKNLLAEDPSHIITLNEPACGSGGMIIAYADFLYSLGVNYSNNLLVFCGDLDKRCVHMTYLQLSLLSIPAIILHQDALSLETWDEWHTPALCMNWLRFRNKIEQNAGIIAKTPKQLEEERKKIQNNKKN